MSLKYREDGTTYEVASKEWVENDATPTNSVHLEGQDLESINTYSKTVYQNGFALTAEISGGEIVII